MITVDKMLANKGRDLWSIHPEDSVFDAIRLMDEKGIGALVVLLEDALIGVISERDCARKVILKNRSPQQTKVKEIMTRQVYYTFPDQTVDQCMAIMSKHHIRHLPVMQDKKIIGMVAIGDVVKEIIAAQQFKIEHLEHYILWEEAY